ncbi:MAG: hypothetical protein RhofKO_28810 [Rhodothermales bacterium]
MFASRSFGRTALVALLIWLAGVVAIRLAGDYVLVDGLGFIIGYVALALAGPPTVWIGAKLIGFETTEMVGPTIVIAWIALILDGFVMGFMPEVYAEAEKMRYLAPMFLWGFGWACLSAYVMAKHPLATT